MTLNFNPKSCLVVIDIQKEYKDVYGFDKFKENTIKLINKARKEGVMVCFVNEKDIRGKSHWLPFWEELQGKRKLDKGLPLSFAKPKLCEHHTIKTGFDAFFNTDLHMVLQSRGIETLYMCGLLTGACVLNSIFTGYNLGYRIHLVENCCSDRTKARHDSTLRNYRNYLFIGEKI